MLLEAFSSCLWYIDLDTLREMSSMAGSGSRCPRW